MYKLGFILFSVVALGCGGSDISEDQPIADAATDQPDADPDAPDASPDSPDADPNTPDASPDSPDAQPSRAQVFCDRYDSLCGYDTQNQQRFDDEATCLTAFDGFGGGQKDCVENELDQLENDNNLQHCRAAMGNNPCN